MASRKSLIINSMPRKKNAENLKGVRFLGLINENIFAFSMKSQSNSSRRHKIYIKLEDLNEEINNIIDNDNVNNLNMIKTAITIAMTKNIKILCTCEDFLYSGAMFWNTKNKSGLMDELRPPKPYKKRTLLCKHILFILKNISRYMTVMAKSLQINLNE